MSSQIEVRGCVPSVPFVGEGPAGDLIASLLSDDTHGNRAGHTCDIIRAGALHGSQPPGLEDSDVCVVRVEAQAIECAKARQGKARQGEARQGSAGRSRSFPGTVDRFRMSTSTPEKCVGRPLGQCDRRRSRGLGVE
jgi:hypothetical protein